MTTTLITGANKGLGKEAARRLIAAGHVVWVAARDPARGRAAADELGARFVALDVTDDASVEQAAAAVAAAGGLDVLVNNAGVAGLPRPVVETTAADVAAVFDTNVLGPVRLLKAFAALLDRSLAPVVVNVSSGLGSIAQANDPNWEYAKVVYPAYSASKAALNMLTVQWAKAFPRWRVNAVDPGYTATDINANSGTQTVAEGTDRIVEMARVGPDGPTGTFSDRRGPVPW
jgi:NAD(P)-dependent dehydrogenase (short-subunit alcohol dehydrogenase family)